MRTETQSLHESIILSKTHFYLSTLHLKKLTLGGWKWYHAKRKYRLIWSISLDELKTSMLKNCESRAIKTFFFYYYYYDRRVTYNCRHINLPTQNN